MARLFTSLTIKHPFQDSFFARERHLGFLFNKYSFECKTNMLLVVDEKSEKEIIIYVHDTSTCILPVKEKNIFVSYEIFFFFQITKYPYIFVFGTTYDFNFKSHVIYRLLINIKYNISHINIYNIFLSRYTYISI